MATQTASIDNGHQNHGEIPKEQKRLVQAALSNVLQSTPFKTSRQAQQLLQYIVQQSVEGHIELLKERIIGAQVFGRRADYDTNDDPVVRTRAGEVRKRLAQYYLGEGCQSTLRIEISPGSYHATFLESSRPEHIESIPHAKDESEAGPVHQNAPACETKIDQVHAGSIIKAKNVRLKRTWLLGAAAVLATSVILSLLFWPNKPIEVFWQPLLEAKKPVVIYSGANAVYMLSSEFMERYRSTHRINSLEDKGREFVVPLSPDTQITAADLVPYNNEFVTLGDLSANVRVAALLTLYKKSFDMRSGQDVAFSDLHESPSLLIGAFNNTWTMELTGDLPFVFDRGLIIRDRNDRSRSWTPKFSEDGAIAVDYAVITRIPHSKTNQPLITIAGIMSTGTRAAADFVTSPELLNDFLQNVPKGWASRNMQIVLQTNVVNNIPTTPIVVATRYW